MPRHTRSSRSDMRTPKHYKGTAPNKQHEASREGNQHTYEALAASRSGRKPNRNQTHLYEALASPSNEPGIIRKLADGT
eukprot:12129611-Alexandrium_andersonii.AAC.1